MKKIFLVLTVMSLLVSCGGNSTEASENASTEATSEATSEATTSDSTSVEATSNEVKK